MFISKCLPLISTLKTLFTFFRWYVEILRFIISILPKQEKRAFLSELKVSWQDYMTVLFTDMSDEPGEDD